MSHDDVVLPGSYEAQLGDDAVLHSKEKLRNAAEELQPFVIQCTIVSMPCQTNDETLGYRCKCSFQVLKNENGNYQYAMRQQREALVLGTSRFPIANRRIQWVMQQFSQKALAKQNDESNSISPYRFPNVVTNLASLTLAASWDDHDSTRGDCILTLNYDNPLIDEQSWILEAQEVCQLLNLTQLHGRSRKRLVSAKSTAAGKTFLRDTIYLHPPNPNPQSDGWRVSLNMPNSDDTDGAIPVHYEKPEGAFFHPNARVMCQALQWMLDRLSFISTMSATPCHLLELYCGCGAHTMALVKACVVKSIQAIELDPRLVEACQANIKLNFEALDKNEKTPVQVVRSDAGKWAKEQKYASSRVKYNILLVDPPRQGLDDQVIQMALQMESLQHMLIISCGHAALIRDLGRLCPSFDIIYCAQLDLFPRTDSVETLVHLKRRYH